MSTSFATEEWKDDMEMEWEAEWEEYEMDMNSTNSTMDWDYTYEDEAYPMEYEEYYNEAYGEWEYYPMYPMEEYYDYGEYDYMYEDYDYMYEDYDYMYDTDYYGYGGYDGYTDYYGYGEYGYYDSYYGEYFEDYDYGYYYGEDVYYSQGPSGPIDEAMETVNGWIYGDSANKVLAAAISMASVAAMQM